MSSIDESYLLERDDLFRYFDTMLLSKLLYINYVYSNVEYNGTTGDDAFNDDIVSKIKNSRGCDLDI